MKDALQERTAVVIPVSSPDHLPDVLADIDREVGTNGANVAIVLVDNGRVLRVSKGALSVSSRSPLRLQHLHAAVAGTGRNAADIWTSNVFVAQPERDLGWRAATQAGTRWLLSHLTDITLVAFAGEDIRLSPDFFGAMQRTYRSVRPGGDPRVALAPLYDGAFAEQVSEYLGPADRFPQAGSETWKEVGVVDGTFQLTTRVGAMMTVVDGLEDLGASIPGINDKIIAMLRAAPLESLPFLCAALQVAKRLAGVDVLESPEAGRMIADKAGAKLMLDTPAGELNLLAEALNIGGGRTSRGITAVAGGAYVTQLRDATDIDESVPARTQPEGLRDESTAFARFKLGVATLASKLQKPGDEKSTPTRAVVSAITSAGDEPGAWATVLKDPAFGGVAFGGLVESAPEIRKAAWLRNNPQFQQRAAEPRIVR
jgi:hypothetical protein